MIKRMLIVSLLLFSGVSTAEEIRVAVASNFTHALANLANRFESQTGHTVTLIVGSTGQHYAQIKNGAPFDAFFAADTVRPGLLDEEGIALPGSRFTYATGKLVLWSPEGDGLESALSILQQGEFRFLAIANPRLAPYGKAAQEVLQAQGVWEAVRGKMVLGQNIGQAYQFVKSRSAELGFVAYSQLKTLQGETPGYFWEIPQALYTPIQQQAVLLTENKTAKEFWRYVKGYNARQIIRNHGYETPPEIALISRTRPIANDGTRF
ncbi:MAG: molybdate ABC transporter substrate-binding protein [Proteobacteria bacterium]|nr:molybdate ABC transporter substrate-binding protein [Pseudomonadota bacterium]